MIHFTGTVNGEYSAALSTDMMTAYEAVRGDVIILLLIGKVDEARYMLEGSIANAGVKFLRATTSRFGASCELLAQYGDGRFNLAEAAFEVKATIPPTPAPSARV